MDRSYAMQPTWPTTGEGPVKTLSHLHRIIERIPLDVRIRRLTSSIIYIVGIAIWQDISIVNFTILS